MEEKLFPHIAYKEGKLFVESIDVSKIAEVVGTPAYVYSRSAIEDVARKFTNSMGNDGLVCYAVKACSNVNILKVLAELGLGADTVSKGEILRCLLAGFPRERIIFTGVGKTKEELEFAILNRILLLNVESEEEAFLVAQTAERLEVPVKVSVRVNPDVKAETHKHITTGTLETKFGISIDRAYDLCLKLAGHKYVDICGIHFHIGSQIKDISTFKEAGFRVSELVRELKNKGFNITYFDAGGGLGVGYKPGEEEPPVELFVETLKEIARSVECKLIVEPGRRIVANAGILLTRILYRKEQGDSLFYIVDAGMNDFLRTSLYGAVHEIVPVRKKENVLTVKVAGPICESSDVFAESCELPLLERGELLAILGVGAYGFVMSSNYNSRGRPPEVLVEGDTFRIIRRRESFWEQVAPEICI